MPSSSLNFDHGPIKVSNVKSKEDENLLRDFMIKTYYAQSTNAKALKLTENYEKPDSYIKKEIDACFDSGCSMMFKMASNEDLVGGFLLNGWAVSANAVQYDPVEVVFTRVNNT